MNALDRAKAQCCVSIRLARFIVMVLTLLFWIAVSLPRESAAEGDCVQVGQPPSPVNLFGSGSVRLEPAEGSPPTRDSLKRLVERLDKPELPSPGANKVEPVALNEELLPLMLDLLSNGEYLDKVVAFANDDEGLSNSLVCDLKKLNTGDLELGDLIQILNCNNAEVQSAWFDVQKQYYAVDKTYYSLDPNFSGKLSYSSQTPGRHQNYDVLDATLTQPLASGGNLSAIYNSNIATSSDFIGLDREYTDSFSLAISQPLGRGAGNFIHSIVRKKASNDLVTSSYDFYNTARTQQLLAIANFNTLLRSQLRAQAYKRATIAAIGQALLVESQFNLTGPIAATPDSSQDPPTSLSALDLDKQPAFLSRSLHILWSEWKERIAANILPIEPLVLQEGTSWSWSSAEETLKSQLSALDGRTDELETSEGSKSGIHRQLSTIRNEIAKASPDINEIDRALKSTFDAIEKITPSYPRFNSTELGSRKDILVADAWSRATLSDTALSSELATIPETRRALALILGCRLSADALAAIPTGKSPAEFFSGMISYGKDANVIINGIDDGEVSEDDFVAADFVLQTKAVKVANAGLDYYLAKSKQKPDIQFSAVWKQFSDKVQRSSLFNQSDIQASLSWNTTLGERVAKADTGISYIDIQAAQVDLEKQLLIAELDFDTLHAKLDQQRQVLESVRLLANASMRSYYDELRLLDITDRDATDFIVKRDSIKSKALDWLNAELAMVDAFISYVATYNEFKVKSTSVEGCFLDTSDLSTPNCEVENANR